MRVPRRSPLTATLPQRVDSPLAIVVPLLQFEYAVLVATMRLAARAITGCAPRP
jgi:hypothetical protein